jgi:hypothetical protein
MTQAAPRPSHHHGTAAAVRIVAVAIVLFAWAILTAASPAPNDPQARASAALERMAWTYFGDLNAAELQFVRHAPYRDLVWSSPSADPDNPVNDPSRAATWGKERTIRADIVRWILTDPAAAKYVHPSGIGIAGARIAGTLDLSYMTVTLPITLLDCVVADGLELSFAHIVSIDLRRSWTGGMTGRKRSSTATSCCDSVITATSISIAPRLMATSIAVAATSSVTIRFRWSRQRSRVTRCSIRASRPPVSSIFAWPESGSR